MGLGQLFRKHKLALIMRNIVETSALVGHALRRDLLAIANQKRSRRMVRELKEKNNRLTKELTTLKEEFDESVEGMKANVEKVTKENQTLEKKNANLEAALEAEKKKREEAEGKEKTMESRLESFRKLKAKLDKDLNTKAQKNKELQAELNKAGLTLSQVCISIEHTLSNVKFAFTNLLIVLADEGKIYSGRMTSAQEDGVFQE
ncbi:hypothetical protein Dimus_016168 [Dionaea muscipula]